MAPDWLVACYRAGSTFPGRKLSSMKRASPLLLVAVLLASGCGSGRLSDADYRARISNVNVDLTNAASAISGTASPKTSVPHIRAALGRLADSQDRIASVVGDLKPPKRAEAANALLAKGARDFSKEIRATQQTMGSYTSHAKAVALLRKNLADPEGVRELSRAFAQLHRLGYFM
jgi:hypothetical protein